MQETTYKYVGSGGDYDAPPRRDFTCLTISCCLLSLLLLIPLLLWLFSGNATSLPYDCEVAFEEWETAWSPDQQEFCCTSTGRGCTTALPETTPTNPPTPFPAQPQTLPPTLPPKTSPPTLPPTRPPAPSGPVDPFNCAVAPEDTWAADKKEWCCRVHHQGCPQPRVVPQAQPIMAPVPQPILPPVQPIAPAPPADPYNCADGFANWQAGWSVAKKEWCCQKHGKGCADQGAATSSAPYDCDAGFANWQAGWSVPKKAWCCSNVGKGCPPQAGGCA